MEDESWVKSMKEELDLFEINKLWTFTEKPKNYSVIRTKWYFETIFMKAEKSL